MKHYLTKSIAVMLILGFVAPTSYVSAQFVDPVTSVQSTITAIQEVKATLKEFSLDKIALKIGQRALDRMTDSVVTWAAGGFKHEGPSFIANASDYWAQEVVNAGLTVTDELVDVATAAAKDNISTTDLAELKKCDANERIYRAAYKDFKDRFTLRYTSKKVNVILANSGFKPYFTDSARGVNDESALMDFFDYVVLNIKKGSPIDYIVNYDTSDNGQPAIVPYPVDEFGIPTNRTTNPRYDADSPNPTYGTGSPNPPQQDSKPYDDTDPSNVAGIVKKHQACIKGVLKNVRKYNITSDLLSFVGQTIKQSSRSIASKTGVPDLAGIPNQLKPQWENFKIDASAGGWYGFNAAGTLQNSPIGAKIALSSGLSNSVQNKIADTKQQLLQSGGYLDKGKCIEYKVLKEGTKLCVNFQAATPGDSIRVAVNTKVLAKYQNLQNIDDWSELLLAAGWNMVQGVLYEGLLPLAQRDVINPGIQCITGNKEACSSVGSETGNIFSKTEVASSNTPLAPDGKRYDDVIDIEATLYGERVASLDAAGNQLYEDSPELDATGKPLPDYTKPRYEYKRDRAGAILYKLNPDGTRALDGSGKPLPRYNRVNGALSMANEMYTVINNQYGFIYGKGIAEIMKLDKLLPLPDFQWEERFDRFTGEYISGRDKAGQKTSVKEIVSKVKSIFESGVAGVRKVNPEDIALVSVLTPSVPYTRPAVTFSDFDGKYPREVDEPDTIFSYSPGVNPFPSVITLQRSSDDAIADYNVVSMDTSAGYWKNPASNKTEAVGNIPIAKDIANFIEAQMSIYRDTIANYKRKNKELTTVISTLQDLTTRYESLVYPGPNPAAGPALKRRNDENQIAYEISLIRDKLPLYDDLAEQKLILDRMKKDLEKINNYSEQIKKIRTESITDAGAVPGARYGNLFVKDNLGVLYCGLQDHSLINKVPFEQINSGLSDFQKDRFIQTFGGLAPASDAKKTIRNLWNQTYSQRLPVRCFETSVLCSAEYPCPAYGSGFFCPLYGHSAQDTEYHMEGIPLQCKQVYQSNQSDYTDYVNQ